MVFIFFERDELVKTGKQVGSTSTAFSGRSDVDQNAWKLMILRLCF